MKWIIFLLLLLPSICSAQDSWDKTDKILFTSFIALEIIDYTQTNYIFEHDGYYERNPIIDEIGQKGLPIYFGLTTLAVGLTTDYLKPKYRTKFLIIMNSIQLFFVFNNYSLGIGFSF